MTTSSTHNHATPSSSSNLLPPFSPDPNLNIFSPPTMSLIPCSNSLRFSTLCATVDNPDEDHRDLHGSSSVPIYQSATFKGMDGKYDYTRSGNPTRTFLQHHIAKISAAKHAFAVTSGMGALDIICRTLKPGDQIIAGNDLYGGSNRLLAYLDQHNGIHTHHVDTTSIDAVRPLLVPGSPVKMVLLESPTNPLLQIVDVEQIAREVKRAIPSAIVVVDNTMMSPYLMRPLELGADIVYDSATKYLSGHHDLMAGVVVCNDDALASQLAFVINSIGNGLAPFECFLLLRGIKTLAVRLDRQQASARLVAAYLAQLGFKVNYPGLASHPRKHVHDRLAAGPGAVLSFETGDKLLSERIVSSTRLWGISVSFGCVNSLISMPCLMSHASIDPAVRAARNLPEDLIRLCVGIEDSSDLVEDLQSALVAAGAIRIVDETAVGGAFERVRPASAGAASGESQSETSGDCGRPMVARPDALLVSAPGKVILFGEHAVVYGQRAVAAAVGLRCFCLVESAPPHSDSVALVLPDIGFTARWPLAKLPWDAVPEPGAKRGVDEQLARMVLLLTCELSKLPGVEQACHAFLYLYMSLAKRTHLCAQTYTVRSTIPIGAGLGSSAAYSVCLAGALLYSHEHIALPRAGKLDGAAVGLVNGWAFVGEKIIHGSPSGVDNTVASHGGALCFRRMSGGGGVTEPVKGFGKARLLITDTRVGRDTKALVAGVARRKTEEPDFVQRTIEEIGQVTEEAIVEMQAGSGRIEKIGVLMERNHGLLSALGVSHERIECVREVVGRNGLLGTKLTGAGGGGCAISLVPDEMDERGVRSLVDELESQGMKCYVCEVGGKGMGVMEVIGEKKVEEVGKMFLGSGGGGVVGEIEGWVF